MQGRPCLGVMCFDTGKKQKDLCQRLAETGGALEASSRSVASGKWVHWGHGHQELTKEVDAHPLQMPFARHAQQQSMPHSSLGEITSYL